MRDTPTKSPAFSPAQVRFTAHQVRETANKHIHGATKRMLLMLADMIETQEARAFVSNNVGIQRLAEDFKAEAKESGRREVLDEISKCFHSEDGDFVDSSTIRARLERLLRAQPPDAETGRCKEHQR